MKVHKKKRTPDPHFRNALMIVGTMTILAVALALLGSWLRF